MLVLETVAQVFIVRCSNSSNDKVFYFEADAQKYICRMVDDGLYNLSPTMVKSELLRYIDEPDVNR